MKRADFIGISTRMQTVVRDNALTNRERVTWSIVHAHLGNLINEAEEYTNMPMHKSDYEALARCIAHLRDRTGITTREHTLLDVIAERIANYCMAKSSLFNRDVFLKACEYRGKE